MARAWVLAALVPAYYALVVPAAAARRRKAHGRLHESLPAEELRRVLELLKRPTYTCKDERVVGGTPFWGWRKDGSLDGEWWVCFDQAGVVEPPCVVYSFGVGWDWNFDERMAKPKTTGYNTHPGLGCDVFSFDPSMELQAHEHSPGLQFRPYALGTEDAQIPEPTEEGVSWRQHKKAGEAPRTWTQRSVRSLMQELGHDRINVLKMDVETAEWPVLLDALESGLLDKVDQLLFEAHLFPRSDAVQAAGGPQVFGKVFDALERHNFKLFHSVENSFAVPVSDQLPTSSCFEQSYLRVPPEGGYDFSGTEHGRDLVLHNRDTTPPDQKSFAADKRRRTT